MAGVALIVLTGFLFDARVIAWSRSLSPTTHGVFEWITQWGQSDWLLIPSGIVVIVVILGDWRRVSRANAAAWWEIATFAAVLFFVVAATGLTTDIIKPIVGRFRPDYVTHGAFAFAPLSFGGYANYSFPSGHATTMAAVAVIATFVPGVSPSRSSSPRRWSPSAASSSVCISRATSLAARLSASAWAT